MSFNWFTGIDLAAEQSRGDYLDAQLAELNRRKFDQGRYTQAQFERAELNRMAGVTGNIADQVAGEFKAGLAEGLDNVTGTVNRGLAGTVRAVWRSIPWQVWALAAVALFFWMGGLQLIRGSLAKK